MDSTLPPDSGASPTPPPPTPPPPPRTPPPIMPPTAKPVPARPRRSWGWIVISLVLLVLLGISVLFNLGHLLDGVFRMDGLQAHREVGPRLEEVVVEDNDASAKIAVVPIEGVISGQSVDHSGFNMVEIVKAQLKRADKDDKVKAVILKVDSPGGEVLASDEIAKAIRKFQDESGKPVIVSMGNLAASGGYYVSAPCRYIIANELTITGSIGVIMSTFNYRGLMDKVGVQPYVFKSGKFKDMLSGSRAPGDISPEERAMVQKWIDETYQKFKGVVAEGRKNAHEENKDEGKALSADWADYADGRILSGKEALDLGFVDEVGDFEFATKRTREIAGIKAANLVEYRPHMDLGDLLGIFGKTESRALKVDLGIELPKVQAGRPYFLSPTYLP